MAPATAVAESGSVPGGYAALAAAAVAGSGNVVGTSCGSASGRNNDWEPFKSVNWLLQLARHEFGTGRPTM